MKYPLLTKLANAEDELTGDAYEVFAFRKVGNRRGELKLGRDKARDAKEVYEALVRKNARLTSDETKALALVKKALISRPCERVLYAARCGWRPKQKAFVTSRTVIGPPTRRRLVQPLWISDLQNLPMRRLGTIDEWKATVAATAAYSAPAMLSIATAFAAPLLAITGRQPFGINLFGPSKIGKTAAALAGASVIGIGRETDLPNWAATHAARGEQARIFNDMLLPINEVGLLAGSKKAAYGEIRTLIYNLGEGRERRRHSASFYTAPAATEEFRTVFLSTAEYSFDQYASIAGETRDDGEYARCIDVPAFAKRKTIVSVFPKSVAQRDRTIWARNKVIELRRACEQQHGTAFAPYIEYLIANRSNIQDATKRYSNDFMRSIGSRDIDGALEHAAENCGMVYAGGCIAIDGGILPWSKPKLLRAINQCFGRALDQLGRAEDAEVVAVRKLELGLRKSDIVCREQHHSFSEAEHHGYFKSSCGTRTYFVHAKRFREWFCSDDEVSMALYWLKQKGYLSPRKCRSAEMSGRSTAWAEQTPKWPNGKSVRTFVFSEPVFRKLRST